MSRALELSEVLSDAVYKEIDTGKVLVSAS